MEGPEHTAILYGSRDSCNVLAAQQLGTRPEAARVISTGARKRNGEKRGQAHLTPHSVRPTLQ